MINHHYHHRRCPLGTLPSDECAVCEALTAAERDGYSRGWQDGANGRPAAP
jgi:hypothetical protein